MDANLWGDEEWDGLSYLVGSRLNGKEGCSMGEKQQ